MLVVYPGCHNKCERLHKFMIALKLGSQALVEFYIFYVSMIQHLQAKNSKLIAMS